MGSNGQSIRVHKPGGNDSFYLDRSLSEDLFGDDDLESFLSELVLKTEGRIDVRSIWDYISSRSELNCSLQFTKFYEPINSEQFLVDQTKQNDNEMEQVRVSRTNFKDQCSSYNDLLDP